MDLQKLLDEIQDLLEAKRLLEMVYSEISPYRRRDIEPEISDRLRNEINKYFKFDDSE